MIFLFILCGIPLLTGLWLWRVRRALSGRCGVAGLLRQALTAVALLMLAAFGWLLGHRAGFLPMETPAWLNGLLLLWSLLALPLLVAPVLLLEAVPAVFRKAREAPPENNGGAGAEMSRRDWLRTAALSLPALGVGGAAAVGFPQCSRFRVSRLELPLTALPAELDGLRITHFSDTHVGRFTNGAILGRFVEEINRLDSELVLFTGDLIDFSMAYLPQALDMLAAVRARLGLFVVEGNHDLFDDAPGFRAALPARGLRLLQDGSEAVLFNGREVEIMGSTWAGRDEDHRARVDLLLAKARPGVFPIYLAHHPHAFDAAAGRGLPLTLAGHTHGGQLMLSPRVGCGPLMFRYWSGLYRKGNSALVVNNGAGNWFPLRSAAPAEIVQITLRRARL